MTKQEYYDLLVKSAQDGTFPSSYKNECRYRKDATASCKQRCAIGLLMPNEVYNPDLEGRTANGVRHLINYPNNMENYDLASIQRVHDEYARRSEWSAEDFVARLNDLPVFDDVAKTYLN